MNGGWTVRHWLVTLDTLTRPARPGRHGKPAACHPTLELLHAAGRLTGYGWTCLCGADSGRSRFGSRDAALDDWQCGHAPAEPYTARHAAA